MKKFKRFTAITLAFLPLALVSAVGLENPINSETIQQLLTAILKIVVEIGVVVLVMAIIWVGFMFVKAQGEPAELEKARKAFLYTVIGAGVVLGAKVIQEAIKATVDKL